MTAMTMGTCVSSSCSDSTPVNLRTSETLPIRAMILKHSTVTGASLTSAALS